MRTQGPDPVSPKWFAHLLA